MGILLDQGLYPSTPLVISIPRERETAWDPCLSTGFAMLRVPFACWGERFIELAGGVEQVHLAYDVRWGIIILALQYLQHLQFSLIPFRRVL